MATKTPGRMRVLHIVPAFFDANDGVLGGGERYALELARYMAEEVPTKLVTFGEKDRLERVGNLDVRVIGQPWKVRGQSPERLDHSPWRVRAAAHQLFCTIEIKVRYARTRTTICRCFARRRC